MTTWRLRETLIRWKNVHWGQGRIETVGKRGLRVSTPLTPELVELLEPLKGHHKEFVFTYVCRKPKKGMFKGKRYPITYMGARSAWRVMRGKSGVTDFRLHDVRHDSATRLMRETGNIKVVMRALNHSDIKTTARYAHVADAELADAMGSFGNRLKKSPTSIPTAASKKEVK